MPMISFDAFVLREGAPIYLQIVSYLQREAAAGRIRDGDELPSRRVLSARLAVNPNTVQKAYRLLEETGLMRSHPGQKASWCWRMGPWSASGPSFWQRTPGPPFSRCAPWG